MNERFFNTDWLNVDYRDVAECEGGESAFQMQAAHAHSHIEIFLCLTDGIGCLIGDETYVVGRYDVVIFGAGVQHRTFVPENAAYRRYVVSFNAGSLLRFAPDSVGVLETFHRAKRIVSLKDDPEKETFLGYFAKLRQLSRSNAPLAELNRFATLLNVLLFLAEKKPSGAENFFLPEYGSVLPVITYLNEHMDQRISLDSLCEKFFMSRSKLTRAFRRVTGLSVGDYLRGLRLVRAKNMLIAGAAVNDIANECGFGSTSQLIRVFHKETGFSPKRFAKYNVFFEDGYRFGAH